MPFDTSHHTGGGAQDSGTEYWRAAGFGGSPVGSFAHRDRCPAMLRGVHSTIDDKISSSPWAVNALRQAARAAVSSEERQDSGGSNRPPKRAPCVGWANDALLR